MERKIRWYDYITVNIFYFALTARSQTLTPLILPLLVQTFMGDEVKGAAYGNLRLWALMIAVLVQGLVGILSDRSTSRLGRRRPFILIGGVTEVLVFLAIGVIAATLEGPAGYWTLFAAYILSMLSSNTGHAAAQGLIPDLVPEKKHGIFSGVKAFFELPAPLIFVSFVITKMVEANNIWGRAARAERDRAGLHAYYDARAGKADQTTALRNGLETDPAPGGDDGCLHDHHPRLWQVSELRQRPGRRPAGDHRPDRHGRDGCARDGYRCDPRRLDQRAHQPGW